MKRIAVIGCPGAGKTTFSQKLARQIDVPLVHLDYYYHDTTRNYSDDKASWQKRVTSFVDQDSWIIDGNYKSTFGLRLPRADTIIFFDFPRRTVVYRILKRRLTYHNRLRPDMPEGWKEKVSRNFIKFVWNFNSKERRRIYELLSKYDDKDIVIFKKPQQVREYLNLHVLL